MKTTVVLASILAAAGSAVADSPFRLLALSKGATFDGTYVRGTGGRFVLGKQTNTTCGSTAPMFTSTNNTITTYGDGRENTQLVSVDIAGAAGGLLSYKNSPSKTTADDVTDGFSTLETDGVEHLLYKKSTWLACPQTESNVFSVYAEEAYTSKSGKQSCIPFVIATQTVDEPKVCQMV
ncbi:hypothetical protein SLS57_006044 [Botryosphaeria dothidea]